MKVELGALYCLVILTVMACHHPPQRNSEMVKVGPDAPFSLVIYFKTGTTSEQVENFNQNVLKNPPDERGADFKFGIGSYLRLSPRQANGHWAIAISFLADATEEQRNNLDQVIETNELVYKVFENIAPEEIKASDLDKKP